ncbi:hypothetical protein H6P81_003161 [Aristolochia fimbriata]|uniref:GrpE protein homolog n=1 Tax=Aristolochia fimbriata TaxID=158543 RepID=A0AAV7FCK2_ARIFI|nr:hypothetical protein H6P81_003161 [Aristolochia fimbriata]
MASSILRSSSLLLCPQVVTSSDVPKRVAVSLQPRRLKSIQTKFSLFPKRPFRFPVFLPFAAQEETAATDEIEETTSEDTSDDEVANEVNNGGVEDADEASPSVVTVSLQSYKEALQSGDTSKLAEVEAFLLSIENEKKSLAEKVAILSAELSIERDRVLRISADFDNFRKRTEREKLSLVENVQGEVVESLLPVLDNFERAKAQIKVETEGEGKVNDSYQSIYKQFVEILNSLGVEAVETIGKPFDPLLHEAIMQEESTQYEEGVIIEEYRKGFRIGERLLRASMVKVSAGPGPAKPAEEPTSSADSSGEEVSSSKCTSSVRRVPLFLALLLSRFPKTLAMATQSQMLLSISAVRRPSPKLTIRASGDAGQRLPGRSLRVAVVGGGPAGASAAETLAAGGVQTFLIERSPAGSKPCGGAIPLCMLDEFSLPPELVDRRVTRMKIISPSNRVVDFGSKTLGQGEYIAMLRREVLDSFLRRRAESNGAELIAGLVTGLDVPAGAKQPYTVRYIAGGERRELKVDAVVGADGANGRVAKEIRAGSYSFAIAFQERIKLPDEKMCHYENLAEMYVGSDISPDFYGWVFPKCDHVAVGTGTVSARGEIKTLQAGIRERVRDKIAGGRVIKVEAHPIPEHPRPRRVVGRVALVGDAAGYVTKCSGEGIYFAAKSGRMCGEAIVRASEEGRRMMSEADLKREYLRRWDDEYLATFRALDLLQRVFYGSNAAREALVEMCGSEYVQRMTFQSYLYKKLAPGDWREDMKMAWDVMGSLVRARIADREMRKLVI